VSLPTLTWNERDALRLALRWVRQGDDRPLGQVVVRAIEALASDPDERALLRLRVDNRFRAVTRPHPTSRDPFYGYPLTAFEAEERYETREEALTRTIEWVFDCSETHDRRCKCGGWREPDYMPLDLPLKEGLL
jgi:hypothetical protein